ncbi:MAG: hypothetical protein V4710_16790 [Verrucomicrobiota bacterium]
MISRRRKTLGCIFDLSELWFFIEANTHIPSSKPLTYISQNSLDAIVKKRKKGTGKRNPHLFKTQYITPENRIIFQGIRFLNPRKISDITKATGMKVIIRPIFCPELAEGTSRIFSMPAITNPMPDQKIPQRSPHAEFPNKAPNAVAITIAVNPANFIKDDDVTEE